MEETVTELAVKAGFVRADVRESCPRRLDLILCATMSGDSLHSFHGLQVQERIGASCPAFDVNAACSGLCLCAGYARDGYFCRGGVKKVLVVAAEAMSRVLDWADRTTCVLFGDGAGAVVLRTAKTCLSLRLTSHGDANALLWQAYGGIALLRTHQRRSLLAMNGEKSTGLPYRPLCGTYRM